jgi:serine-type D-Ala-D-Ala carboxypeptidase/endopeptidase (penicillin-binding protein 4)
MRKTICLIPTLIICVYVIAGKHLSYDFISNSLLENANVSILITDLKTGDTVCSLRRKNSAMPASTMKLITTATALEVLGPEFRFHTDLLSTGVIDNDSTLKGNIIIRGGGDPTLGSARMGDSVFMTKWVDAIKKKGIKRINGNLIADESIFDREGVNASWMWEDMGNYYAAGAYGIAYMDNQYKLVLKTGMLGTCPTILRTIPEMNDLIFDNHLTAADITDDNSSFHAAPKSNLRSIYGKIPANKVEFVIKGDIPNPSMLLLRHFKEKLLANGVTLDGELLVNSDTLINGDSLYRTLSPTLKEIITETNMKSNNLYAEHLFRYIASTQSKQGNAQTAIKFIKNYWQEKGMSVDQLFMNDGSGLSPANGVSANFFVELLSYMRNKSKYSEIYFQSLPVAGQSGTLKSFLKDTPLEGKVHAKSGTIARVKCYAGYIDKDNKSLAFAVLVNNSNGNYKAVTRKIEDLLSEVALDEALTAKSKHHKRKRR